MDGTDPLAEYLIKCGMPAETDFYNLSAKVFTFPIEAPSGCTTRQDVWALDQLKLWKMYASMYCEHKPSITVQVRESEWMDVGAWVYRNFDEVSGVSFLPYDTGTYSMAPYEEISESRYKEETGKLPVQIDWEKFKESEDSTVSSKELACSSGVCEL